MLSRFMMVTACLATVSWSTLVFAQGPTLRPNRQPAISPYTNLLNRNNSFLQNYYQRVRPELEFREGDARLSQSLRGVQTRLDDQEAALRGSSLGTTGHGTTFLNYGSYYKLGSGGGSRLSGGRAGGARAR